MGKPALTAARLDAAGVGLWPAESFAYLPAAWARAMLRPRGAARRARRAPPRA